MWSFETPGQDWPKIKQKLVKNAKYLEKVRFRLVLGSDVIDCLSFFSETCMSFDHHSLKINIFSDLITINLKSMN